MLYPSHFHKIVSVRILHKQAASSTIYSIFIALQATMLTHCCSLKQVVVNIKHYANNQG